MAEGVAGSRGRELSLEVRTKDACFDGDSQRGLVDGHDPIEGGEVEEHAALDGNAAAVHAASPSRWRDRGAGLVARGDHCGNLLERCGTHDDVCKCGHPALGCPADRDRPPVSRCLLARGAVVGHLGAGGSKCGEQGGGKSVAAGVETLAGIAVERRDESWFGHAQGSFVRDVRPAAMNSSSTLRR